MRSLSIDPIHIVSHNEQAEYDPGPGIEAYHRVRPTGKQPHRSGHKRHLDRNKEASHCIKWRVPDKKFLFHRGNQLRALMYCRLKLAAHATL